MFPPVPPFPSPPESVFSEKQKINEKGPCEEAQVYPVEKVIIRTIDSYYPGQTSLWWGRSNTNTGISDTSCFVRILRGEWSGAE